MTPATMTATATERVLSALAAGGWKTRNHGRDRWRAQCPAHRGDDLNLAIATGDQGVLLRCHSHGCTEADIAAALALDLRDLFDSNGRATYTYGGGHTVTRTRTPSGKAIRQDGTPATTQLWTPPSSQPIGSSGVVLLAEGEKTADALVRMGARCAATWPGGSGSVGKVDLSPLAGRDVILCPDRDEPGEKVLRQLVARLDGIAASVRVWRTPATLDGQPLNDAADLWLAGGTLDDLTADEPPALAAPEPTSTWTAIDTASTLDGLLNGTHEPLRPSLAPLEGGGHLFYPGRVHSIAGESGAGKSWLALAACAAVLNAGDVAVYVDLEDSDASVLGRLLALGVDPRAIRSRFTYVRPDAALGDADRDAFLALVTQRRPALVVIDSTGEAFALDGLSQNDDDAVAHWFRRLPRAVAALGPAVLLLDHVVKADDSRGLWAIGSHRKRAAIDGAAFILEAGRNDGFSREHAGRARLVCAKDRPGTYRRGQHVADMLVCPDGEHVSLRLVAADDANAEPRDWRPTVLMERVSVALAAAGSPLSFSKVAERVTGKRAHVATALDLLVREGYVSAEPGPRNSTQHTLLRPFPTASPREPVSAQIDPKNDRDRFPVLKRGTGEPVRSPVPGTAGEPVGNREPERGNDHD